MKPWKKYLEFFVLVVILYSIVALVLEFEFGDDDPDNGFFLWSERFVAVFFTVEYVVRWVASRRLSYPLRPMAVIDLLAVLPFYFGFLIDLRSLRMLRAVRMVRLLKLYRYTNAFESIRNAFHQVRYEFGVIGFAVFTLAWVCSVAVYELEREAQPQSFARFSDACWYTAATLTTVGYGDKVPVTSGGKLVAVFLMVGGLGLFGTFVSLIGSAFLEELRKNPRPRAGAPARRPLVSLDTDGPDRFEPAEVLKAIEAGAFNGRGEEGNRELARLLTSACRQLQGGAQSRTTD